MRVSVPLLLAASASSLAAATPASSAYDQQLRFVSTETAPALPLVSWFSSKLSSLISSKPVDVLANDIGEDDEPIDKSIWEFIQEMPKLSQLKRVLKYAGNSTKDLLDDKEKELTFFAPLNVERKKKEVVEEHHALEMTAAWERIVNEVDALEEEEKEKDPKRRKMIAFLIDATIRYHLVDASKPLIAAELAQNSTVASLLKVKSDRVKEIVGNLLDGEPFRIRVGKTLIPGFSIVLNGYSPIVYRDVKVGKSIVHGVRYPLFIPPSTLQALFYGQDTFSSLTSAAQKVYVDTYLKIPFNRSAVHHHHHHDDKGKEELGLVHALRQEHHHHHDHHETHGPEHAHGLEALTLFAPGTVAFARLPAGLKLFLFSPFGKRILQKVIALHTLPRTAFYADATYGVQGEKLSEETADAGEVTALFGDVTALMGKSNVTRFRFDTALPKLNITHHEHSLKKEKPTKFEQVDVDVYRYYLLPGEKGPLQTRVAVEGIPVLFQDIATANGAVHLIERFIMPKSVRNHTSSLTGATATFSLWNEVVDSAERAGYGRFNLADL